MEEKIEQLKHVEQQLECQKTELRVELERNAKRAQEDVESLKRQHAEEVEFLQQSNKQLKVAFLYSIWFIAAQCNCNFRKQELLDGVLTANKWRRKRRRIWLSLRLFNYSFINNVFHPTWDYAISFFHLRKICLCTFGYVTFHYACVLYVYSIFFHSIGFPFALFMSCLCWPFLHRNLNSGFDTKIDMAQHIQDFQGYRVNKFASRRDR